MSEIKNNNTNDKHEDMHNDLTEKDNDGRKIGEWASRYNTKEVKTRQFLEASYLLALYVISFLILFINYKGTLADFCNVEPSKTVIFTRMITCAVSGLLGGTVFTTKWFYRSIAHGSWNWDRTYWRFFSPLISLSFAYALACILKGNIIVNGDGFTAGTLGFLAGYFSDKAAGKMSEVADVLFPNSKSTSKKPDKNTTDTEEITEEE